MIGFIAFGAAMLIALLIFNLKMDSQRVKLYEYITRVICLIGMICSFYRDVLLKIALNLTLFSLVGCIVVCMLPVATDYVQYIKNRDDPATAQKIAKELPVYVGAMIFMLALSIFLLLNS